MCCSGRKIGFRVAAFVFSALMLAGTNRASAAQVTWRTDVVKAANEAEKLQKPLLLQIGAPWCGFCKKMLKTTYMNSSVIQHVNGCFIPVQVDADRDEKLVKAIGIEGLPTTVIISPELKVLKKLTGYKSAQELAKQLGEHCPAEHHQTARATVNPNTNSRQIARAEKKLSQNYAFGKLCLVSLLDGKELVLGSTKHFTVYRNRIVCFASEEFKNRFAKSPEKYWPMLDGNCPVSAVDDSEDRTGDPEMAVIFRGKIWLCADLDNRGKFAKAPRDYSKENLRLTTQPTERRIR